MCIASRVESPERELGNAMSKAPLYERDWRVPLKNELGVNWKLDPTHHTEYTQEEWLNEINTAGLTVDHQEIRWGEIWAKISNKT